MVRSQIRRHIRSNHQRPELPKVEIPIDHRLRPAGSGIADMPLPGHISAQINNPGEADVRDYHFKA